MWMGKGRLERRSLEKRLEKESESFLQAEMRDATSNDVSWTVGVAGGLRFGDDWEG